MRVPAPQGGRWKEQLKEVALDQRATILRHRDLVAISMGRIPMGPHALRYTEAVVAILRAGGVPDDLAVSGYLLLFALVNGFTMDEMAEPVTGSTGSSGLDGVTGSDGSDGSDGGGELVSPSAVSGYLASLPADQFPNITAVAPHFAQWDNDVQFGMLVDLYVDGLAQRAAAASGPPDA
jgi:TetR/AcrR family tetracycline transcriptional repressor